MFLKQISALEFSFVDSPGGTTHHHPDEFYNISQCIKSSS